MDTDRLDAATGAPPGEWPEHFQGLARIQSLPNPFPDGSPAVFAVHFDAGGRSRPHTHRDGQMLIVTSGQGLVGDRSGRRTVVPGDIVVAAAGEWHWHGATPDSPMTHITIALPGTDSIDWDVDEGDWAMGYPASSGSADPAGASSGSGDPAGA